MKILSLGAALALAGYACLLSVSASAEELPLLGHNLSPTTYTLPRHRVDVGNYFLGYGLTDELTIGTSPWLAVNYNMPALVLKYGLREPGLAERASVDLIYFKTAPYALNWFKQESLQSRLTLSHAIDSNYRIHSSLGLQYFIEDYAPFSLRPPATSGTAWTASISALHEIRVRENLGVFVETGVLGANYPNPFVHLGLSAFYRWSRYLFQLGASMSRALNSAHSPEYLVQQYWAKNLSVSASPYYRSETVAHPEIQFQVMF